MPLPGSRPQRPPPALPWLSPAFPYTTSHRSCLGHRFQDLPQLLWPPTQPRLSVLPRVFTEAYPVQSAVPGTRGEKTSMGPGRRELLATDARTGSEQSEPAEVQTRRRGESGQADHAWFVERMVQSPGLEGGCQSSERTLQEGAAGYTRTWTGDTGYKHKAIGRLGKDCGVTQRRALWGIHSLTVAHHRQPQAPLCSYLF